MATNDSENTANTGETNAKTAPSTEQTASPDRAYMLSRQKSRSRERRESRLFLVDGQLCWTDDQFGGASYPGSRKRQSSVGLMFGSSMDLTGIGQSIDSSGGGSGSDEAISYRIKWCRENILQLKRQTWPMEKKLKVLKASKLFIKQHQGELKQSKQAKDVIAGTSAIFERYWRHFKREFANFLVIITPWEMRIKKIESHFGSVVASYFTFLRWIFWLNLANSLVMVSFVMVPELIENVPDLTGMRKGQLGMQQPLGPDRKPQPRPEFNPTLGEMWEFEGFLKFSPIFYGYYSNVEISRSGFWRNPLAFLMSAMLTYLFCFFCISRKLSQNTKLSRIGSKDDEYTFCWTVFVGWDFMIGNSETAYNKTSSLVMNLKEGILEEKEQTKDRDWRLIIRRVFANVLTIMLIVASAYVVTLAVQRSENLPEDASLLQKNELQLVMSGIQFLFPPLFDIIGIIEKYHPRKALSWQLGRILFLDFLNFYTLMFSLFGTVDQMGNQLNEVSGNITLLRKNTTYYRNLFTTTTTTTTTTAAPSLDGLTTTLVSNSIDSNYSTTLMPNTTTTSGGGLNVSTILTSVLLASSTMMPSTSTSTTAAITSMGSDSIELVPMTISTMIPLLTTAFSAHANNLGTTTSTTQTNDGFSSEFVTNLAATTESTTTWTRAATFTSTPTEFMQTATSTSTTTKASADDDDYPDLGEVLKVASSPRRAKRLANHQIGQKYGRKKRKNEIRQSIFDSNVSGKIDETEREDWRTSEELIKRTTAATSRPHLVGSHRSTDRDHGGAFIPPIQDPYGKVGRTQWPVPISERPRGGHTHEVAPGNDGGDSVIGDEYDEEPLEGRLRPDSKPGASRKKGHTSSSSTTTTRRPVATNSWPQIGLARPIGGKKSDAAAARQRGSRVLMTKAPALDDDANEDVIEEQMEPTLLQHSQTPSKSDSEGREPTTASPSFSDLAASFPTTQPINPSGLTDSLLNASVAVSEPILVVASSASNYQDESTLATTVEQPAILSGVEVQGKSDLAAPSIVESEQQSTVFTDDLHSTIEYANAETTCAPSERTTYIPLETVTVTTILPNGTSVVVSKQKKPSGFNASEVSYTDCIEIPDFKHQEILGLNDTFKDKLKSLCWETMFGQEMVKIVVMDLVMTVISAVSFEFMRACFVRYCNRFFFWDLERGFPGYQDFKLAENVLHLVNNQSTVWMGMFFAPGLPAINTVKLAVLMYVRSWAVLTCNIPHETVFKVSKSNNFYYWILLINLLICILPVAYAVTWIRPSWHCGPFGGECRMYIVVTKLVKSLLPPEANTVFKYLTSPGAVIPILIALILIIYYLASTVSSSKEANKELKAQLKKEKEQESAVPEITSTAVIDSTPSGATAAAFTAAPPTTVATAAAAVATTTSLATTTTTTQLNPNALVSKDIAIKAAGAPIGSGESRPPKSLLMPPPI